ncbi:MAG: UDP-N-acetylmuramoyl-L-alanine--D-glutamate ligase [Desulfobulbaceae bacterium]|nr:UDP-N-acetylmuramoyl-L-alanine--D-glutamate ligase [Desulfobulbaceae bacterium]
MQLESGKNAVIIGLGTSGMAAARFLHARGLQVSVSESRPQELLSKDDLTVLHRLGVPIETGGHTLEFFAQADFVIPSPGVPLDLPVLDYMRGKRVRIAGELALAAGKISPPVIGVTGSNGKTTVTSLIGHLLHSAGKKVFVGGNIGTPILDYLAGDQTAEVVVLELSSFQLEIGGSFRPDIGLLLNVSPDHLDRHGSMENYAAAKQRIFVNQFAEDIAILSADDPMLKMEPEGKAGTVLRFGVHPDSQALVTNSGVILSALLAGEKKEEHYDLTETSLSSFVNRLNAAAAILAVRAIGCSPEVIRIGLADYIPPAHRMTPVGEIAGVRFIDDSKGTNIGAVEAALASSGSHVILIAGGRDKGSDFRLLEPAVRKHVRHLILIGEAADRMNKALGSAVPISRADSMEDAVHRSAELAQPGDTVLLSPGCASFDMFTSYAHRGEVFRQAVLRLSSMKQESF